MDPSLRESRFRRSRLGALAAAGGMLLVALLPGPGTAGAVQYPLGNLKAVNGLQMSISTYWLEGNGYRPVTFEFTCRPPARADRRVNITFAPYDWGPMSRAQRVQFEVEIPQGATTVSKTVSVPQRAIWNQWKVNVYEEGRRLKELCGTTGISRRGQMWGWTEAYPTMLFIDRDAPAPQDRGLMVNRFQVQGSGGEATNKLPNVRRLSRYISPNNNYQDQLMEAVGNSVPTDNEILVMLQNLSTIEMLSPADLPTQWIDYTCVDVMLISLDDLRLTIQQHPNQWAALRQYITTGGNLLVYGVGAGFEKLSELEQLLALPSRDATTRARNQRFAGWEDPSPNRYGMRLDLPTGETITTYRNGRIIRQSVGADEPATPKDQPVPTPMFVIRDLGLGKVVAIGPEDPFAADDTQWDWVFAQLGSARWQWYKRNGVSLARSNDDFWDFLIPDVGAAPVKTFLAIITGFMVIIGPINYWFLRKWNRLYLLLVTVPTGAGLITLCLFAYALVIDGLGTRARIRSFTEIDSTTNTAVSWSRQSYYAGLAPSGGLFFPKHTAVYPIDYSPRASGHGRRLVRWGSQQNLASGFLGARSMSQLMVINTAPVTGQIVIQPQGSEMTAINQMQVPVTHLAVCDNDQFYWAEQLGPGQRARLQALPREEVLDRLSKLRSQHRPTRPSGFVSPRASRNYYYYYGSSDDQFPAPSVLTSVLERQVSSLSLLSSDKPRFYVAITAETPATVPMGLSDAEQKAGFHVIKGDW